MLVRLRPPRTRIKQPGALRHYDTTPLLVT
jgi:hypothetical protein